MTRILSKALLFAIFAAAVTGTVWAQGDLRLGTWTLNVAKSKYSPGPAPASETRTYAVHGQMIEAIIESHTVTGVHTSLQYAVSDDGKDYPMKGLSIADAVAMKRIDARDFVVDTKSKGIVIGTTKGEISKDGKVLTLTSTMTTPLGQSIHNVAVYEKH